MNLSFSDDSGYTNNYILPSRSLKTSLAAIFQG